MQPHEQVEAEWADVNELDHRNMVACSSGTAALHLAMEAAKLIPNANVAIPDYTMAACARAVVLARHRVRLLDCDPQSLLIDTVPNDTEQTIYGRPDSVMAVHVYGRAVDMDKLNESITSITWVVEDLAEAHGVKPQTWTDAACWSFYQNKIVGGEEGGAVYFADRKDAEYARSLRSLGFVYDQDGGHDYTHVPFGHNYRMSKSHAELVLKSIWAMPENVKRRWDQLDLYRAATPVMMLRRRPDAPWVHDIDLPATANAKEVYETLRAKGFSVRHGFKPMSKQTEFRNVTGVNTELVWKRVLYINLIPATTLERVKYMAEVLKTVLEPLEG